MIDFGPDGLVIDTFDTALTEIQDAFRAAFGDAIATRTDSSAGQMQRTIATWDVRMQEQVLRLYQSFDPRLAEGVSLVQRNSLLGIDQEPADQAEVLGTASGTPATAINDGVVLSCGGYLFDVIDGPYSIGGGGTVTNVRVRAQTVGPKDVTTLGAWSIVTNVPGFTGFDDTSQPNLGALVELDAAFRGRAEVERYRRGQGPLLAIQASVSTIDEVTYVRAWHNITTDPIDANGIPYYQINVVVEGGDDADVAAAIWNSGPAGHIFFGTDVTEQVDDGVGGTVEVSFDRVSTIRMYVRATLTTSTAEDPAPDDLSSLVSTLLVAYAAENWSIGIDVVVHKLSGALSGIAGVDAIIVETSLDGIAWATTKRSISIRERASLAAIDVTVVEN